MFALRRDPASDLISTPFRVASVLGSSILPRFALLPFSYRMRAAVASRLIVRGLGNFRRVGVAGGSVERLSVVCSFRTVIVRVRAHTHPCPVCTRTNASTYVHPCIRRIAFQRENPLRRYLNAYLALETSLSSSIVYITRDNVDSL